MRIAIVSDAWRPQVNGVVTTLGKTGEHLEAMGHRVLFVTPDHFRTVPCPTYSSIRLALAPDDKLRRMLDLFAPHAVHIATEGPLGWSARRLCLRRGLKFTTAYHTQFPQYLRLRAPVPLTWTYALLRRFHGAAARTLVPTASQRRELRRRGFSNVVIWPRGVDTEVFHPGAKTLLAAPRPISIYAGRVAVEKNIEAFLGLTLPGTKVVVGDGPDLEKLRRRYPTAQFAGYKPHHELAPYLAAADVFVFPSRTDTFGIVMLEAMACGLPVAAFPVTGPVDVVRSGETGVLSEDLGEAVRGALRLDGRQCREFAIRHSWRRATERFASYLVDNRGSTVQSVAEELEAERDLGAIPPRVRAAMEEG